MTVASKLPSVEDALLLLLKAQTAFGPTPVKLGDPGASPPAELVYLAEAATSTWIPDVSMQVAESFVEMVELHVRVWVSRSGDDYLAVRDRAQALTDIVTEAVSGDPTLSGTVEDGYVSHVGRLSEVTAEGRAVEMTITVSERSLIA